MRHGRQLGQYGCPAIPYFKDVKDSGPGFISMLQRWGQHSFPGFVGYLRSDLTHGSVPT